MNNGFHLPHNAILPNEVKFILDELDERKEFYLYDDLKAMMFSQEIKKDVFKEFHPGMYKNFMEDEHLHKIYDDIKNSHKNYDEIKGHQYTDRKTINGVWNEQARDYFEFIAFTGLMPSYYKGRSAENEKRYYISTTFKKYKAGLINYADILFNMKFRNASKDYTSIEQYDVRNRPFVVAIKLLNKFKEKGYEFIDMRSVAYLVKHLKNEDLLDEESFCEKYVKKIDFSAFSDAEAKEAGRAATFLKRHLVEGLNIKLAQNNRDIDLNTFNYKNYSFKNKAVFIGDIYDDLEVTPLFLKCLNSPSLIEDIELKNEMIELGLIDENNSLYDFNIDTDLMDRSLVIQYINDDYSTQDIYSTSIESTELFKEGKIISESGNGTKYEEFLYNILLNKFGENRVTYLGANTLAQRLSDILLDVTVQNDDIKSNIRIIIEAKSGGAITSFDERKEKDDVLNTLSDQRYFKEYDGVWYMVVDSNKIPSENQHGGFRNNTNQVSFKQKLLRIQSAVMPATQKLTMVTAFSYSEFMKFIDSINFNKDYGLITKIQAKDFWTWSNKFIETSYVTIRA